MSSKILDPIAKVETKPAVREPIGLFDVLEREMADWFTNPWPLLMRPLSGTMRSLERKTAGWVPRLDAWEQDGELIVKVDLPGMEKKDIKVELVENELVIHGERLHEVKVEEKNLFRMERSCGSFLRRLPLDFVPDPGLMVAHFKNGVLEIKIPIPVTQKVASKVIPVS